MVQNIQNQDMSLNLSTDDAKPRLKWTPNLHQRFINAIGQLGGADKATPKSLMRVMGIHRLTLYHLKSHLQKYRKEKQGQQSQTYNDDHRRHREDNSKNQGNHFRDETQNRLHKSLPVSHAQQIQMEVQRKLQEQIKVQRHLQLRIEAQGKYLESVLKKAKDTLAGYSSSSVQAEVSQLVDNGCPSSSVSSLGRKEKNGDSNEDRGSGRKRSGSSISDGSCVEQEQPLGKRAKIDPRHEEFGSLETTDLNNHYVSELDSVPNAAIDLNSE